MAPNKQFDYETPKDSFYKFDEIMKKQIEARDSAELFTPENMLSAIDLLKKMCESSETALQKIAYSTALNWAILKYINITGNPYFPDICETKGESK